MRYYELQNTYTECEETEGNYDTNLSTVCLALKNVE
jgi:hypothetical protein